MKPNKVAPWVGQLEWVGEPRTGTTRNGSPWSSVDFVLKYKEDQGYDRFIMFNVFGNELTNTVLACDLGTTLKVEWRPDARKYNEKWFGKLEVSGITVVDQADQAEQPKEPEPAQPAPAYAQQQEEETAVDGDLPF